ncbi:MAG: hypothetical protein JNK14_12785 [Chitinophagaceae bacterium]|nr:hypothetical protein [Chitinophagaceae bacterium]
MKQHQLTRLFPVVAASLLIMVLIQACSKPKKCETNSTFSLTVKNTLLSGGIQFNVDRDFTSINGPGEYSVAAGESITIDLSAGSHVIKARSVVTTCNGNRCSISVTAKPDKTIEHPSCAAATLVY